MSVPIRSLTYVNVSEVFEALNLPSEDMFDHLDNSHWTYGDTMFSLVGNREFLAWIFEIVNWDQELKEKVFGGPGVEVTPEQEDTIASAYWNVVEIDAYINLEG